MKFQILQIQGEIWKIKWAGCCLTEAAISILFAGFHLYFILQQFLKLVKFHFILPKKLKFLIFYSFDNFAEIPVEGLPLPWIPRLQGFKNKNQIVSVNAPWGSFNGRCEIQNSQLCLSFYLCPNISDRFFIFASSYFV